jgi:hypothetical protein
MQPISTTASISRGGAVADEAVRCTSFSSRKCSSWMRICGLRRTQRLAGMDRASIIHSAVARPHARDPMRRRRRLAAARLVRRTVRHSGRVPGCSLSLRKRRSPPRRRARVGASCAEATTLDPLLLLLPRSHPYSRVIPSLAPIPSPPFSHVPAHTTGSASDLTNQHWKRHISLRRHSRPALLHDFGTASALRRSADLGRLVGRPSTLMTRLGAGSPPSLQWSVLAASGWPLAIRRDGMTSVTPTAWVGVC